MGDRDSQVNIAIDDWFDYLINRSTLNNWYCDPKLDSMWVNDDENDKMVKIMEDLKIPNTLDEIFCKLTDNLFFLEYMYDFVYFTTSSSRDLYDFYKKWMGPNSELNQQLMDEDQNFKGDKIIQILNCIFNCNKGSRIKIDVYCKMIAVEYNIDSIPTFTINPYLYDEYMETDPIPKYQDFLVDSDVKELSPKIKSGPGPGPGPELKIEDNFPSLKLNYQACIKRPRRTNFFVL